jgi:hypothetical protein
MARIQPPCVTVLPWLKANLGPCCLGCLTGYSARALSAAVQIIAAYNSSDSRSEKALLTAFREIVLTLDPPERELAYHAIAHIGEWSSRDIVWRLAELPPLESVSVCKYERP